MNNPVERRTENLIPAPIVSHIEQKFSEHANKIERIFKEHTGEEMERYQEILDLINSHRDDTERKHKTVMESLSAYVDKTEKVYEAFEEAFPTDKRCKPDFAGHAKAHESWMDEAKATKELREYIRKVVIGAGAIAVCSWLWAVVWPAFLNGPK
jgi:hypothetical protein